MPNYPCPPVGFHFTEENIVRAKAFYAVWLLEMATFDEGSGFDFGVLNDYHHLILDRIDFSYNRGLPWWVCSQGKSKHYTFTETPLPEGETNA